MARSSVAVRLAGCLFLKKADTNCLIDFQRAKWAIYFKDGEKKCDAKDVFQIALAFWTGFIWRHEIGKLSE